MPVWKLILNYQEANPEGHFFDKDTLKFFRERESEMRVLCKVALVTDFHGEEHECYVLSSLQRNYPGGARRSYAYFDMHTFEHIIGKEA